MTPQSETLYNRLFRLVSPWWPRMLLATLCMSGVALCAVAPPWLMRNVVDGVLISKNEAMLNILALVLVGLFLLKGVCAYGQKYLMNWVGQRIVMDLRLQAYEHMQSLSLRYIHARRVGELLSRVTNDANVLQTTVSNVAVDLVVQGLTCVGMVSFLFYLNWKLMCYSLVVMPLVVYVLQRASSTLRSVGHDMQSRVADLSAVAEEALAAIRIVRAFATEELELKRFSLSNHKNFKVIMKGVQVNAVLSGAIEALLIAALALILWLGGRTVIAGGMTPGDLIAFLGSLGFLAAPINNFTRAVSQFQYGVAAAERIFDLLDNDDRIVSPPDAVDPGRLTGKVVFDHLWFGYDDEQWVLRDLSLSIEPGQTIAIVGSTGAGKSTLVDLVQRFYDPQKGRVLLDGFDLKSLDLVKLRRQIGVVPQDPVLMKGALAFNISYGYDATDEEIRKAARMAGIEEFIESLPEKYETEVGVRGVTLSGGQRQRIAIARAVIRDPRILILDEATSSLDAAVELQIQQAMDQAMEGRTSFVIAHRLSTVRRATRILFLQDGHVLEEGSHDELMARDGAYRRLFELQYGDGSP